MLCRRVEDLCHAVFQRGIPRCTQFLSDREQELAQSVVNRLALTAAVFIGGFSAAERSILCLLPDAETEPPQETAVCLRITAKNKDASLTHRDYLGALLGLGLKRGCIGDIVCASPVQADIAAVPSAANLITEQLNEVGSSRVTVQQIDFADAAQPAQQNVSRTVTVASLRADAVLAAALNCNRALASQFIARQAVTVNHVAVTSAHLQMMQGDVITVKGKGKFKLSEIGSESKKGRTFITIEKYT